MVRMARLEYEEQAHTNDDYSNPPPLLYLHLREIQALRRGYKGECTFIVVQHGQDTPQYHTDVLNGA